MQRLYKIDEARKYEDDYFATLVVNDNKYCSVVQISDNGLFINLFDLKTESKITFYETEYNRIFLEDITKKVVLKKYQEKTIYMK